MEGRAVSHYRILKRLGAGGRGVVYQAGGHFIIGQQRSQVVKAVLDWLDARLGPVTTASPAPR